MDKHIKFFMLLFMTFVLLLQITSQVSAETYEFANATDFLNNINNLSDNSTVIINSSEANITENKFIFYENITIKTNGKVVFNLSSGIFFRIGGSNLTLQGITFKNGNYTSDKLNSPIMMGGSYSKIINCTFINNTALSGGALTVDGEYCSVINCSFINNTAIANSQLYTGCGGAVKCVFGNCTLFNCTFINNKALSSTSSPKQYAGGGAIYWGYPSQPADNGKIINCTFINNNATGGSGGAIFTYMDASKNCTVINCTFKNNTAHGGRIDSNFVGGGGAICWCGEYGTLINCTFDNNLLYKQWDNVGSAVYWANDRGNIINCTFIKNVYIGGDESDVSSSTLTIRNRGLEINCNISHCTFIGNNSSILLHSGYCFIKYCSFINNTHAIGVDKGHIMYCNFTNITINAIRFENPMNVEYCNFYNNSGDIFVNDYYYNTLIVKNCNFTSNKADYGGAIKIYGNNSIISNSIFTENIATNNGSAIYLLAFNCSITNCSFINNTCENNLDGSIFMDYSSTANSYNTTFINNSFSNSKAVNKVNIINNNNSNFKISGGKNALILFMGNATIDSNVTVTVLGNETKRVLKDQKINLTATLTTDGENNTIVGLPFNFKVNETTYDSEVNNTEYIENYTADTLGKFDVSGICRNVNGATLLRNAILLVLEPSELTIKANDVDYGDNVTVFVNVTGVPGKIPTGNVTITINGVFYTNATLNSTGQAKITIPDYNAGNYIIEANYNGDGNFYNSDNTTTVTIRQLNSTMNINITPVTYGNNVTVLINVTDINGKTLTEGNVSFTVNGVPYTKEVDSSGNVNITVPNLESGTYNITVKYNTTNRNYNNATKNATIIINLANATINITVVPVNYGVNSTVQINVTGINGDSLAGSNVSFELDHVVYNATLGNDGKVSIVTSRLDAGVYEINVSFNTTNKNYNNMTRKANITVNPVTPIVNITVAEIIFGDNATIQVNVTGVNGNIPSGNVTLKINGTWKSNMTLDNQGNAKFILSDLGAGGYLVEVIFNSTNTNYSNAVNSTFFTINQGNATIDISVNDTIYGNNVTVLITVTDKDGKKLNGNVTISIDGRELNTVPLTDGEVLYNITESLSATEHMITVKFTNSSDVNYTDSSNSTEFNVIKGNTTVNIDANATTYGDNLTLIITVTGVTGKTPTGNLTITVDGTTITDHLNLMNGKAHWNITGLSAGTHTINVTYNGNENYTSSSNNTSILVNRATPEVNITVAEITYGENATVQINVTGVNSSYVTGNVTITVDNVPIPEPVELVNGAVTWNSTILSAGKHNITVTYNGNGNYYNKTNRTIIIVREYTPKVNITVDDITYGENATVNITVIGSETIPVGTATLYINGTMYNSTSLNDNGKAVFSVVGLNAGRYFIEVNYTSTDFNYTDSYSNDYVNVSKANSSFNIDNITYGDDVIIISGNSTVSGNITVSVGDLNQTIGIVNGSANVNITEWNLPAGNYTAEIIYSGDDNYENITTELDFTIEKGNATFQIDNITYSDGKIVISTNTTIDGNITVTINDETKTVPIIDGSADLNITDWGLSAGDYTALINFTGNENYTDVITEVNFTISKSKSFININSTVIGDDGVLITLKLTDEKNNPISGNVTVNIISSNGYRYVDVFYVDGSMSFELDNLSDGLYNITATFNATEDYECSSMNNSFLIDYAPTEYYLNASDVVKYYKNGTQYIVKLTDNHGSPVANQTILVTLNSVRWAKPVSYNITTNASGIATLEINLLAGEYSIVATFSNATPEFSNIAVIGVDFVLTADDVVKYYKNGTHYMVTVTSQFGYVIPNEAVTFRVYSAKWSKPAVYTIKTNSSGVAVLPINLIAGVYTISATVGKTTKYNNIAVYPTLTASSINKKISQSGSLKAKLVDGQGNPASGKEVTFTVGYKTYTFTTDVNGIATLPIHLGLGTWSFLIADPESGATTRATVKVIQ